MRCGSEIEIWKAEYDREKVFKSDLVEVSEFYKSEKMSGQTVRPIKMIQ